MRQRIETDDLNDSVGLHMRRDVARLRKDQTIGEALESLRAQRIGERIAYLYVVDGEERLAGVVPVRRFLAGEPAERLESVMVGEVVAVPETATVLAACEMLLDHRFLALPVVDAEGHLTGAVDINLFAEEVSALARRREVGNAFQLIGVHVALGRRVPPWISFRDRFPWLLSNIASGLVCAFIASRHEPLIASVTALALFLTVVLALGESVSMQSLTITLQGLSRRTFRGGHLLATLRRELSTALLLGAASALAVGLIALAWRGNAVTAAVISGTIILAMVTACMLGVAFPIAVHALRLDPKVAAGPIVLAMADIATLVYYFTLGEKLLRG